VPETRGSKIGNVIFETKGESFNCNMSAKDIRDGNVISCRAKFIMLVEKYVVLSRLAEDEFHKKYECIIITGRGQPDVLTRQFLRKLSVEYKLTVLALMDCNPSGIRILSGYRYGLVNVPKQAV
jgi:DNA topoisomerase VI subunit A